LVSVTARLAGSHEIELSPAEEESTLLTFRAGDFLPIDGRIHTFRIADKSGFDGGKRVSQDLFGVTTPNVRNRTLAIRESPTRWMSESA